MTDSMGQAVAGTYAAMGDIERIVRSAYTAPDALAAMLCAYADAHGHSVIWVAKKAHEVLRDIAWERWNAPLNAALGLDRDFVG